MQITGDTFDIRDQLKSLGCKWVVEDGCWFAPDESTRLAAQALADELTLARWRTYCATLAWAEGCFTSTAWDAGLRAATLGLPKLVALEQIKARIEGAGKKVTVEWMNRNVSRAYEKAEPPPAGKTTKPPRHQEGELPEEKPIRKPEYTPTKLAEFAGRWATEADALWLADRSPLRVENATSGDFLTALYRPGEKVIVCDVFASQGQWLWSHEKGFESQRVDYRSWDRLDPKHEAAPPVMPGQPFRATGPQGIWYLCNPVNGEFSTTGDTDDQKRPRWSRRWERSVTSWRYFVLESDQADPREWVGAMVQLPIPIAAIYTSGGKSIHVLLKIDARSKAEFELWRETAKVTMIPLGADPQCMSGVRLTRLPSCLRELDKNNAAWPKGPRSQRLLYLDGNPSGVPIINRPPTRDTVDQFIGEVTHLMDRPRSTVSVDEINALLLRMVKFRAEGIRFLIKELSGWRAE